MLGEIVECWECMVLQQTNTIAKLKCIFYFKFKHLTFQPADRRTHSHILIWQTQTKLRLYGKGIRNVNKNDYECSDGLPLHTHSSRSIFSLNCLHIKTSWQNSFRIEFSSGYVFEISNELKGSKTDFNSEIYPILALQAAQKRLLIFIQNTAHKIKCIIKSNWAFVVKKKKKVE